MFVVLSFFFQFNSRIVFFIKEFDICTQEKVTRGLIFVTSSDNNLNLLGVLYTSIPKNLLPLDFSLMFGRFRSAWVEFVRFNLCIKSPSDEQIDK